MQVKLFSNIKFNKKINLFKNFPKFLSSNIPKISNNRCENINMIKYGSVWKTTSKSRNRKLINWINKYLNNAKSKQTILELGASSGISVLPGIKKKTKIKKYFLTDLQLTYYYKRIFTFTLLFSSKKSFMPFMSFNNILILYSDKKSFNFIFSIISYLIRFILAIVSYKIDKKILNLLDDRIIEYQKKYPIIFREYNVLSKWHYSRLNIVIAQNLFNNSYFSKKLMEEIVSNIYDMLKINDQIIIGDNKDKASIFKKSHNRFISIKNLGGKVQSHYYFSQFLNKK